MIRWIALWGLLLSGVCVAQSPASTYCVFSGYLTGDKVSKDTHDKYEKISTSGKIDLSTSSLKANPLASDGKCQQPTCRDSDVFGIPGTLSGRLAICTR